jgi:hypothetical protein
MITRTDPVIRIIAQQCPSVYALIVNSVENIVMQSIVRIIYKEMDSMKSKSYKSLK